MFIFNMWGVATTTLEIDINCSIVQLSFFFLKTKLKMYCMISSTIQLWDTAV